MSEYTIDVKVNGLEDVERLSGRIRELIAASERVEAAEPDGPRFTIGDVVSLKSGGPRMTVESISEEDGTMTAHCSWFALLSRDPAFPAWDQDGVRYAPNAHRGVFAVDCLEY